MGMHWGYCPDKNNCKKERQLLCQILASTGCNPAILKNIQQSSKENINKTQIWQKTNTAATKKEFKNY